MVVRGGSSLLMSVDGEAKVTVHIPVNDCNSHFDYWQLNLIWKQWECMLVKIAAHKFCGGTSLLMSVNGGRKGGRPHPYRRLQISLSLLAQSCG
ncbi:hypothetical protein T07_11266 [Trichinella nelsoni]|uniref:Uncharacterized protein n=1 Tax=Trichinella nelsoni TaxID=6336 RepID=A0A0V0SL90_9BILA|nr:hypothetical protein T07_11266 [Trichinella nelsoni]